MFKVSRIRDTIEIPPRLFGRPLEEAALEVLRNLYEDSIDEKLGYVIMVLGVESVGRGKIVKRNPATIHEVEFTVLSFIPEVQEVLNGRVIDVTEFGLFVRIGPVDGLVHISQVMDDYVDCDKRRGALIGREKGRFVEIGDSVRVRVVSVGKLKGLASLGKQKVSLTMRQPGLGKLEWLEKESRREEEVSNG